jgi:hypothetical protein
LLNDARDGVVGTTSASPAAFYSGPTAVAGMAEEAVAYRSGDPDVRYVPATVRAETERIDLDGWSTSTSTRAQDYNSSRSNKPSTIWVPDPLDDDSDGDGIETFVTVLDIERELAVYVRRGLDGVGQRSADDAKAALDAFVNATTTALRPELDACSMARCGDIRESSDGRVQRVRRASDAVDAGNWTEAERLLQEVRRTVDSDIETIGGDLDSDGDGLLDGTEELYAYLDDDPVIGERFVVSLPAAELPGDRGSLAGELTPERLLDYFLGQPDGDSCLESDRSVSVHRDLSCRSLLTARLDERKSKNRAVVALEHSGSVVVTGASPAAEGASPMLFVDDDGKVSARETPDSWGEERTSGAADVTPTLVCPVVATPADCPCPMPALLYVRRIRHDDQILFAGGWLVDDGALYEDAATLLAAEAPNVVAGVTRSDVEDGGVDLKANGNDRVVRKKPGRTKYADITLSVPYDSDHDHLPADTYPVCRGDGNSYWDVQSRADLAVGGGDCDDTGRPVHPASLVTALDAPILHLVGAAEASNDVKFKAGAELSKAVN